MSKILGKASINPKRLNDVITGKTDHRQICGKFRVKQPDGSLKWYNVYAATDPVTGKVQTSARGEIELNVREQPERREPELLAEPEATAYEKTWSE